MHTLKMHQHEPDLGIKDKVPKQNSTYFCINTTNLHARSINLPRNFIRSSPNPYGWFELEKIHA